MGVLNRYRNRREHNGPVEAFIRWVRDGDALASLVDTVGRRELLGTDTLDCRDDVRSWRVTDPELVRVEEPVGHGPVPANYENLVGEWKIPPSRVFEIPDATVHGTRAIQFDHREDIIVGPAFRREQVLDFVKRNVGGFPSQVETGSRYLGIRSLPSPDIELDTACVLVDKGDTKYFHWICQFLSLLKGVEAYRRETGLEPTLVIPAESGPYHRRTLALLGYDESKVLKWSGGTLAADRLVFPTKPYTEVGGGWKAFSASALRWVSDNLVVAVESVERDFSSNVYISRADTTGRRVTNERELLNALEPFGFEAYVPSTMSMDDQLRLFAGADNIVAPHGSAPTSSIFARDPRVLELQGPDNSAVKVGPHIFGLSEALDFPYQYCICEQDGRDMIADVDAVSEIVREWMVEPDDTRSKD